MAAVLVLVIASVNVASMLSARAIARRREMALRTALGAGRARLVRQLLTESLLLFLVGAVGGLAVAWFATAALERIPIPGDESLSLELSPDPRVFVVRADRVARDRAHLFGLAPALQGVGRGHHVAPAERLGGERRATFVRGERAHCRAACALARAARRGRALHCARSTTARAIDPGFDPTGVATAPFNTESWGYDSTRARAFYRALRERVASLPGVTARLVHRHSAAHHVEQRRHHSASRAGPR